MSVGGEERAEAGWYPDPWTPARTRYWNGESWTFATTVGAAFAAPAPADALPLGEGHGLPAPVVHRPATATTGGSAAPKRRWPAKWVAAVVVGLLVGVVGVVLSNRSPSTSTSSPGPGADRTPSTEGSSPSSTPSLSAGNDPSAAALGALVVKPEDVPAPADVVLFPGGAGLAQATLDLCNGRYPSESRRTARIQDAVLDAQGGVVLSTEAVLYADSGGTTQALAELEAVVALCPRAPVSGGVGKPAVTTKFSAPPDSSWPQVPSVNRRAYDLTSDDGSGVPARTIAVYLQRGRALLGVYFSRPDGPQPPVEGHTTIEEIVGVFAARLAALPTSVVGA